MTTQLMLSPALLHALWSAISMVAAPAARPGAHYGGGERISSSRPNCVSDRPEGQQVLGAALDGERQRAKLRAIPEWAAGGGAYYVLAGAGLEAQGNGGLGWSSNQ
jgi:hypothetical protein